MLTSFRITNLFLIDELDIEVNGGFVAITGESGAGKSMIVRALTLLTGRKSNGSELRAGAEKGFIEASFQPTNQINAKLAALTEETATEWILRREFRSEGRSRAFINDSPVSNSILGEATDLLLRFSLQEDVGALRNPIRQLNFIDIYANHDELLQNVIAAYGTWKNSSDKLALLIERSKSERSDWEWAKDEYRDLLALGYETGQRESLKSEREKLLNIEAVVLAYGSLLEALEGDSGSVNHVLKTAINTARNATKWDEKLSGFVAKLEEQMITTHEIAREIEHIHTHLHDDSNRLEAIEQRLQAIADCERKWRISSEDMPARLHDLQQNNLQYESLDEAIAATEKETNKAMAEYQVIASKLSEKRKSAAKDLCTKSLAILPELGITHPTLSTQWMVKTQPSEDGLDDVHILFSANKDIPPRELGLVISGGQLARLELALLNAGNGGESITLIMDEVDRGVSGRIASSVGKCLRKIGKRRPVVMVTHLPQVAAAAHRHIGIEKQTIGGHTRISAKVLDENERVSTLAAMLGGIEIGKGAVTGARELLTEAQI